MPGGPLPRAESNDKRLNKIKRHVRALAISLIVWTIFWTVVGVALAIVID